ncbi:polyprenol phosphomannose-dependent alpha 1,6 mannosyltransferase MptB [Rathayibacter sp. Leaf296]|uniref:polyprenol phosphomannose-dependent alpha 1,6 mannosyltransferase MptB n=1 Tax=Rathayibacter sp. Leaf296 TaxID=1736327 RepID=UPI0007039ECF|nr:polyprenol phosphomannose-dependent alpha 1,6 mannosyltransferase MptB [Rathayibacter sp. Leaf296]KQQ10057.1 hypothetical protein ASF46_02855 [Rathayibacter sp. Leaf296]
MAAQATTGRPHTVEASERTSRVPLRARRLAQHAARVAPLAMGTVASSAILVGSLGVGYLPGDSPIRQWPLIATLRSTASLTEICAIAVLGGGLLLLLAWLRLRSTARSGDPRALRTILVAALSWCAPLLITVPLFSRDMFSYVAQGRLMVQGIDPYSNGVATLPGWFILGVDPVWADSPTPYGPLSLLTERTAVQLAGWSSPELSVAMLRAVSVTGVVVMAVYVLRLARLRGLSVPLTAWTVVANPLTLVLFVVAGHNDSVMLALILASLFYASTDRRVLAVVLMGAAIAVKPVAVIALPVVALLWLRRDATLRERVRAWLWTGLGALGLVVGLGFAAGVGVGWVAAMIVPGTIMHWYAPMSLVSILVSTSVELTGHDPAAAVTLVKLLALTLAGVVAGWLMLTRRSIDPLARLATALLAFVTASSAIHPWYALWILPVAALARPWRTVHVHLAVYATIFLMCVTLAEPVEGNGGVLDQLPGRVATIAAMAVVGLYVLLGYTDAERVEVRGLVRGLPLGGEILARGSDLLQRATGGRVGSRLDRRYVSARARD